MTNKFIAALFCLTLLLGCGEEPEEKTPTPSATGARTGDDAQQLDADDQVEVPQDGYTEPAIEEQESAPLDESEEMPADATEYDSSEPEETAEESTESNEITEESEETTDEELPAASEYVVQPGDTLGKIARNHDTTVEALMTANELSSPDLIAVGQTLRIESR